VRIECVWCGSWIDTASTVGWPYLRTQALLHLRKCAKRPEDTTKKEIDAAAEKMADAAEQVG
jgi:hypothetical protein